MLVVLQYQPFILRLKSFIARSDTNKQVVFVVWEIPTESIQIKEKSLPVILVPNDSEVFYDLYSKQARQIDGYLDRNPVIWKFIFKPDEQERFYSYAIGSVEDPQGYIIFSQHRMQDDSILRSRIG